MVWVQESRFGRWDKFWGWEKLNLVFGKFLVGQRKSGQKSRNLDFLGSSLARDNPGSS